MDSLWLTFIKGYNHVEINDDIPTSTDPFLGDYTVRFDLIANFSPGETIPWPRTLEMILEQCQLAEEAGFTTAFLLVENEIAETGSHAA